MDLHRNLKTFLAVAQHGSFSVAARQLGQAPSAVTSRINQLEAHLRVTLFERSTRRLILTEAGRRYRERSQPVVAQMDELVRGGGQGKGDIEDFVRVKAPTSLTTFLLRGAFDAYQAAFPKVRLEIVLFDRSVNPVTEGFDLAIGAYWVSFGGVVEVPLCPLRRVVCAAPRYLAKARPLQHPRDLKEHDCLNFLPTGNAWVFETGRGQTTVEITPHIASNDARILTDAAVAGRGVALLSTYMIDDALRTRALVPVLPDFAVTPLWIKAVAPQRRARAPAIAALIEVLRKAFPDT